MPFYIYQERGIFMSDKSQETNMRKLANLLRQDLGYISGEKECGPNGAKRKFLNVGRTFLRGLAKDLGLRDYKVTSNAGGIAVSGECILMGLWDEGGIYLNLSQSTCDGGQVAYYRTIRHLKDYTGGYNHWLTRDDLETFSYEKLLFTLSALRRDQSYERAA